MNSIHIKYVDGGVTAPAGFKASGTFGGIRHSGDKSDMALVYSEKQGNVAAVFTKNKIQAAHIKVMKKFIQDGKAQAVLCNSGNANACTADGEDTAIKTCEMTAAALGIRTEDVMPASTGVIGVPMPIEPFERGIPALVSGLSASGSMEAATAIMTTDTLPKEYAVSFPIAGKNCKIGGIAKGSGMIHINMGTMLSFMTTDCAISAEMLDKALKTVIEDTFNQVTVDGDTSTNDTLAIIANGMAGNPEITSENEDFKAFCAALHEICIVFAKKIAGDGEGCTRLLEVHVTNAPTKEAARDISKTVVGSNLVKAAMFAADANWGRIIDAAGYAESDFSVDNIDVTIMSDKGELIVCRGTAAVPFSEEKAAEVLDREAVTVEIDLHDGTEEAYAWGCDLTFEYVRINAEYRT